MPQTSEFMDVADSDFLVLSATKNRLFDRRRPLHVVLGSGKIADVILWRDKKITASVLVGVTFIWIFYMRMDYTLLSFTCDSLILLLAILFLWTHLTSLINISPPILSDLILPDGLLVNTSISMTYQLNQLLITFGVLASGHDLKKFFLVPSIILLSLLSNLIMSMCHLIFCFLLQGSNMQVTVTLGTISIIDILFAAPTVFYIASVILLIVPAVYERNEDIVDIIVDKALIELNNRYAELIKKKF